MSFTRAFDDRERVSDSLHRMTAQGCYGLKVPGNGTRPSYVSDPHIRLQQWGANLRTGCMNIDGTMRGLGLPLTRDCTNRIAAVPVGNAIEYGTSSNWTDESRATHPAWLYRTVDRDRSEYPFVDPQYNAESRIWHATSSRDMARDKFEAKGACHGR